MWVCRLPVHIDPLGSYEFAESLRKNGAMCAGRCGHRPLQDFLSLSPVGADDSVRPQNAAFSENRVEFATFLGRQRRRPLQMICRTHGADENFRI